MVKALEVLGALLSTIFGTLLIIAWCIKPPGFWTPEITAGWQIGALGMIIVLLAGIVMKGGKP